MARFPIPARSRWSWRTRCSGASSRTAIASCSCRTRDERNRSVQEMKVVIPDLVSNSYFPAIAAVEMGFFKQEGLYAELELIYPVQKCYEALRDGKADFVGGSSHSAPTAFPEWQGVKFLGALAQNTYWFLI